MKILIGTKNPGKIEGAVAALDNYFEGYVIEGVSVSSDVPDQPVNEDIYLGARNRVDNLIRYAKENNMDVDFYLGVESGITNLLGRWVIVNVAVIKDKDGYESWGMSPAFPVPDKYVDKVIETNLGVVMDELFNEDDLNKGKGGISFLTNDVISRIDQTKEAFVMALIQHVNKYWSDKV